MAQWFEADYGVTDDGSGGAASVLDRSGNNRTLTGGGGTANPTRQTGGAGGRPFFQFTSSLSQKFTFTGFNPGATFYTCAVLKGAVAGSVVEMWTDGAAANRQISCSNANGGINCFDGIHLVNSNAQDVSTVTGLVEISMNAGTAAMRYNGTVLAMVTASGFTGATINTLGLLLTFFSDYDLYGGMMFTTLPNATQQSQLREYWRAKYNLF